MSWATLIMFVVAGVLALIGLGLLLALLRPSSPGRTYAFRMMGVMLLSGGFVLGASAYATWQWSLEP